MGVVIEIIQSDDSSLTLASPTAQEVVFSTAPPTLDIIETATSQVIEALVGAAGPPGPQGEQGVQNLFVGDTPPGSPEEGFVWIDTSEL